MTHIPIQKYLQDILDRVIRIESKTVTGYDDFLQNQDVQDIVIRSYEVIGEIVKRLPATLLDSYPDIDWRVIKGFRDFLAHNYDKIELSVVWDAVEKLPILRATIEKMLADLRDDTHE